MEIFNIHLEFNRNNLFNAIEHRISEQKSGYICVCDSSVVARTHNEIDYRNVVNGAFINTCDGSSVCVMATKLYGSGFESVNGPEIFAKYIKEHYKQVIIGNTDDIVQKVRDKLRAEGYNECNIDHLQVPFCKVEDFDYRGIALSINKNSYDIIWVSLGNPKQEFFMSKLLPYLDKGVMFGIGAALNFWVGDLALPDFHIGPLRFIWLTRIFQDPIRQIKMNWKILKTFPQIFKAEKNRKNRKNYN